MRLRYLLLCCTLTTLLHAQTPVADSLRRVLPQVQGAAKVDALNALAFELINVDNAAAMDYLGQALELGKQINYVRGTGVSFTYQGVYEFLSGEFSDGRTNMRTGLRMAEESNDRVNKAYSLVQLGNSYLDQAMIDSSKVYFDKAYFVLKDSLDPLNLSKLYKHLSILYGLKFDRTLQNQYLQRSLRIRELMGSKSLITDGLILLAGLRIKEGNIAEATALLDKAEKIAKTNPTDLENLNDLLHQRALILYEQGRFEQALDLFDSTRRYYSKASLLQKLVVVLTDLGKVFMDRGDYELALKQFHDALRISELKGYTVDLMEIRILLGWVNFHLAKRDQAIAFADLALEPARRNNMPDEIAGALNLKGVTLTGIRNYKTARGYLDEALAIRIKINDKKGMSEAYLNLGSLEAINNHDAAARELYNQSLNLAIVSRYRYGQAWSSWGLASLYLKTNEQEKAIPLLNEAEDLAKQVHASELLIHVYNTHRDEFIRLNAFKDALRYSMLSDKLKDSLRHADLSRRFVNLEVMDEIERKDRHIKQLNQEKALSQEKIQLQETTLRQQYFMLVAGTIGLTLLGILVFVYIRLNKVIKLKNESIQAQANNLILTNQELTRVSKEVSEQNEEIQAQAEELTESNQYINELNRNLEGLVVEKTADVHRTNEELIKHNNELLQFSYTVSHNLRGPVARLLGLTTLLQNAQDSEEANQMIGLIRKTTDDLDLVLKDLSKIIDIRNDLYHIKELVALEAEWQSGKGLLHETMQGRFTIASDFSAAPQLFTIKAMIQSIFYNLLSNSIKYRSPERDLVVSVKSYRAAEDVVISITDNGLGIDLEKYRTSLFKLFRRFHNHVEGRGLGLYLIKSQVEALNGSITIESTLGQGTLFRIVLPDGQA